MGHELTTRHFTDGLRPLAILIVVCLFVGGNTAMALEEPEFDVVYETEGYEIRRYAPYIVAEVDVVADDAKSAGNQAFRILAGYIFGDNRTSTKMAMTAPVESSASADSVKMKMTAPVESSGSGGTYTYAFVMERKYTLETLPEPLDSRIRIEQRPARFVAALRYSGRWSESNEREYTARLQTALDNDGVASAGPMTLARYNSPFSLPFMRRNEILVEVRWSEG